MRSHGISDFSYEEALKKREEEGRDSLFQPISLKDCRLPGNILMAPMAGVTDLPYRILCKEMGLSLSFTEMVSAKAIYYCFGAAFRIRSGLDGGNGLPN